MGWMGKDARPLMSRYMWRIETEITFTAAPRLVKSLWAPRNCKVEIASRVVAAGRRPSCLSQSGCRGNRRLPCLAGERRCIAGLWTAATEPGSDGESEQEQQKPGWAVGWQSVCRYGEILPRCCMEAERAQGGRILILILTLPRLSCSCPFSLTQLTCVCFSFLCSAPFFTRQISLFTRYICARTHANSCAAPIHPFFLRICPLYLHLRPFTICPRALRSDSSAPIPPTWLLSIIIALRSRRV